MLDCPDPIQTSPMRISVRVISLFPLTESLWDALSSFGAGSSASQVPSGEALAVAFLPLNETVMASLASAVPQTRSGASRWTTIPFPKMAGRVTSAVRGRVSRERAKANLMGGTMAEWGGDGKVAGSGKREKHRPGGWYRHPGLFGRRYVWASLLVLPQAMPGRSEMLRP